MEWSDISTIRYGERAKCVAELRAMATKAAGMPDGITYEGGINPQDAAILIEAAAKAIERAFTPSGAKGE